MAELIIKDYECTLTIGGLTYEIPLNEQMADTMEKSLLKVKDPSTIKDIDDINAFYDDLCDTVDELLGEGEAAKIEGLYKHPGVLEIMGVINYIGSEWRTQYAAVVEEMKKTADIPTNRAERRAANRRSK